MTVPLRRVWILAIVAGLYSWSSLLKSREPFVYIPDIPIGLDAAVSFAMALLIAFRINRAYERWWEARTLWGTLVNVSRNLAVKFRQLAEPSAESCRRMRNLIVSFCFGLKDHLRDEPDLKKLPGFAEDDTAPDHLPSFLVAKIYEQMEDCREDGTLSEIQFLVLDSETRMLLEVCGGCEKIKTTLIPLSWRSFTWQCIALYLLVLPWGLVDDFGVWTIPLTVIVAYVVVAGEAIARYVEEPFGLHEDHVDLERITRGIDASVSEVLMSFSASESPDSLVGVTEQAD